MDDEDITSFYDATTGNLSYSGLEDIQLIPMELDADKTLLIMIEEMSFLLYIRIDNTGIVTMWENRIS